MSSPLTRAREQRPVNGEGARFALTAHGRAALAQDAPDEATVRDQQEAVTKMAEIDAALHEYGERRDRLASAKAPACPTCAQRMDAATLARVTDALETEVGALHVERRYWRQRLAQLGEDGIT